MHAALRNILSTHGENKPDSPVALSDCALTSRIFGTVDAAGADRH